MSSGIKKYKPEVNKMGWDDFINVATGGAYGQIGALTGWYDSPSGWSNDWLDTVMPGAGRVTQAITDWQDTGDWAETLNTLTDAPFGGVTGVSNLLGEYTVPAELREYAPAIGGAIGSYAVGPMGAAIGAGIGSDIAGKSAKDKYKAAGTAFGASYGLQGLTGGGWDVSNTPAYDTSGVYSGEYLPGDVDAGAVYDWETGTYVQPASSGGGTGAPTNVENYYGGLKTDTRTPEEWYGSMRTDTTTPGEYYNSITPASYEFGTSMDSAYPYSFGYEPYSVNQDLSVASPSGSGSLWGKALSYGGKALPWVVGAGLVSDIYSQYRLQKAQKEAAEKYKAAADKAREQGTWNETTRANYMKGVSGNINEMIEGMKRRIGSNAAALGRGGGYYGKNVERARQQGREMYAKELANTYVPNYIPPADYGAYLAEAMGNAPWYNSTLSGIGSVAGKWPTLAYLSSLG